MLSGISIDKQNALYIGMPLEKSIGIYKIIAYKSKDFSQKGVY